MVLLFHMKVIIHVPTLKAWMKRANLRRQVDLASFSGLTIGTVSKALNGIPISKGSLSALCLCSGLAESDLLEKGQQSPLQRPKQNKKGEMK